MLPHAGRDRPCLVDIPHAKALPSSPAAVAALDPERLVSLSFGVEERSGFSFKQDVQLGEYCRSLARPGAGYLKQLPLAPLSPMFPRHRRRGSQSARQRQSGIRCDLL